MATFEEDESWRLPPFPALVCPKCESLNWEGFVNDEAQPVAIRCNDCKTISEEPIAKRVNTDENP